MKTLVLAILILLIIFFIFFYFRESFINRGKVEKIPKRIWMFWNDPIDEKTPYSVRICNEIVKKSCKDYEINVLSMKNYKDYLVYARNNVYNPYEQQMISIIDSGKLVPAQVADLLRLYVIYHYGGIYLDASIILLDSLDWVQQYNEKGYNLIMYKNTMHTTISKTPVLENWFIASHPKCEFIRLSLEKLIDVFSQPDLEEELQKLLADKSVNYQNFANHGTYHLAYFVFIYVLQKHFKNGVKNALFLECSNDPTQVICSYMAYYGVKNKTQINLFNRSVTDDEYERLKSQRMVKLIGINRGDIDNIEVVYNSFIDKLLKKLNKN